MDKQRGFIQILIILLILIAIGVGVYFLQQKTNFLPLDYFQKQDQSQAARPVRTPVNRPAKSITPTPVEEAINNGEDLSKALKEVEGMDESLLNEQLSASEFDTAGL